MAFEIIDANTLFGFEPKRKVDGSIMQLRKMLQQNQISHAVTLSLQGIHYDFRLGNQETVDTIRPYAIFIPAFTVDPRRYFGCIEEIQLRAKQGCRLIRLFPELQGWHFEVAPVTKILHAIADAELVLMVESRAWGTATKIVEQTNRYGLPVILTGISYFNFSEVLELVKTVKNVYLEPRILDSPNGVGLAVKEAGANRLIFGSHAPFDYIEPAVLLVKAAHISDEEKRLIFSGNIKRLLQIK